MAINKQCKPLYVKYMLSQEERRGKPFSDDEKRVTWDLWRNCWFEVRLQIRRELKEIAKQERKKDANKTI